MFFGINKQCFLTDLLPPPPPIPNVTQRCVECDEGDNRLALWLAIAEYSMTEPKPKISVLVRRYSIGSSTLWRYNGEMPMSGSQYKQSRISSAAAADEQIVKFEDWCQHTKHTMVLWGISLYSQNTFP